MADVRVKILVSNYLAYRQFSEQTFPLRKAIRAAANMVTVFDKEGKNPRKVNAPLVELIGQPFPSAGEPENLFREACEMYGYKQPEVAPSAAALEPEAKMDNEPNDDRMLDAPAADKMIRRKPGRPPKILAMSHADTQE